MSIVVLELNTGLAVYGEGTFAIKEILKGLGAYWSSTYFALALSLCLH